MSPVLGLLAWTGLHSSGCQILYPRLRRSHCAEGWRNGRCVGGLLDGAGALAVLGALAGTVEAPPGSLARRCPARGRFPRSKHRHGLCINDGDHKTSWRMILLFLLDEDGILWFTGSCPSDSRKRSGTRVPDVMTQQALQVTALRPTAPPLEK